MKIIKFCTLIMILTFTACNINAERDSVAVPVQEFKTLAEADSTGYLLDVRRPEEFAAGHLEGAELLDWSDTDNFKREALKIDKRRTVYIYCRSGRRSNDAAQYMMKQGYTVVDMAGGILAWQEAGFPTTVSK